MSTVAEPEDRSGGRTRRGFVAKLTAAGAAVFAGIAAFDAASAEAYPYHCCGLATDIRCAGCGSADGFRCPPGSRPKVWWCCERHGLYHCGECTEGDSTCYVGPFRCSCGYEVAGPC
jgi:hypothetical protein